MDFADIGAYRSTKAFGYIVVTAFIAAALLYVTMFLGAATAIAFPDNVFESDNGQLFSVGLVVIGLVAIFEIPIRLGLIVFLLIWMYKAYRNLTPLRAYHQEFSPGWAVGWWFVPFLNLVRPYQVVREIYSESDPEFEESYGFLSGSSHSAPSFVLLWWLAFVFGGIALRVSEIMFGSGKVDEITAAYYPFAVGTVLWTISAGLGAYTVYSIVNRQDARFLRILNSPPAVENGAMPQG
ncbi:MAG: DUF4328 domain-containing protein [Pyrinomonadaceae bacterium]